MAKELFYKIKLGGDDVLLTRATDIRLALAEINKELKVTEDNDAYDELEQEMLRLKAALKDVTKDQNLAIKAFQGAKAGADSYRDVEARLEKAREALRRMSKEERDGDIGEETKRNIIELSNEIKSLDDELDLTFRQIGDYSGGIEKALDNILPGFKNIREELAGIGGGGGLVGALSLGAAAFAVGSQLVEIGGEVKEFVEELNVLRREVNSITRETGEGLDELTVRTRVLSERFGADSKDIILAANAVKNEFGIEFGEVFDLLDEGFARGLDKGGEFLDNVREYSAQFADAKFSAGELFSVLELQLTKGIYSDKGVDTIKEAGLSLRELNQTGVDALAAIGISGEEIRGVIGEKGLGAAISFVSERLGEFEDDSVEVGVVLADIFKGAGEDAGIGFVKSLSDVKDGFGELDEETEKYVERQRTLIESDKALVEAQNEVAKKFDGSGIQFEVIGNKIKEFFVRYLIQLIELFEPVVEGVKDLFGSLFELGKRLGIVGGEFSFIDKIIQGTSFGLKLLTDVLVLVVDYWKGVIDVVGDFVDGSPLLQKVIGNLVEGVKNVAGVFRSIPAVIEGVKAAVDQGIENMKASLESFVLGAKIQFERVKTFNPFGDVAEKAEREIKKLEEKRKGIVDSGRSIGEAFSEGYANGLKGIAEKAAKEVDKVVGDPGGGGGRSGISQAEKDTVEREKKRIEKLKELREKALSDEAKFEIDKGELLRVLTAKLVDSEIELMEDGLRKEREVLKSKFEERIEEIGKIEKDFISKAGETEKELVKVFGEGSEKVLEFRRKVGEDLLKVQEGVNKLELDEKEKLNKELLALSDKFNLEEVKLRGERIKDGLFEVERGVEIEEEILKEGYSKKLINEKEFNEELYEVKRKGLLEGLALLDSEIGSVGIKVEANIEGSEEEMNKLLDLRRGLNGDLLDLDREREESLKEGAERELENWKNVFAEVAGFAQQGLDLVGDIFSVSSERRVEALENEEQERRDNLESLRDRLDDARGVEKESLKAKIKIEEEAIKELNKKKEKEEERLAKKEKGIAIAKSLVNTAVAVTKSLPNLVLAAIVGGMGLIQTGIITAQPLADGGVVGDGDIVKVSGGKIGNRGLVVNKSRKGDDRLIYANAGEVVLNEQQQAALGGADVFRAIGVRGFAEGGAVVPSSPRIGGNGGGVNGVFGDMFEALNRKTDAINGRIDKLKVYLVDEELETNSKEKNFIKTITQLGE